MPNGSDFIQPVVHQILHLFVSSFSLYVYAHADLAQKYFVGLQEFFVPMLSPNFCLPGRKLFFPALLLIGLKKYLWSRFPDRPYFFWRPYYFFNAIDCATLFLPGGCGMLIQHAKMVSVVTIIIEAKYKIA